MNNISRTVNDKDNKNTVLSECENIVTERSNGESFDGSRKGVIYALNDFLSLMTKSKDIQKNCEDIWTIEADVAIEYFIDCYYKRLEKIYNEGEIVVRTDYIEYM